MNSFTTIKGSRQVKTFRNSEGGLWTSCLYVNNGETICPQRASHSTEKGARKWAEKQLSV